MGSTSRTAIARDLVCIVLVKLVALALLWFCFFTSADRPPVDGADTSRRFGVGTVGKDTQEIARD